MYAKELKKLVGRVAHDGESDDDLLESAQIVDAASKRRYGTFEHLSWHGDAAIKSYVILQYVISGIACIWVLCLLSQRFMHSGLGTKLAPSPAPAHATAPPGCKSYEYPQCEDALRWYISEGARSRCEAFERVKAEGDLVQFPYLRTSESQCNTPGCCGCPGQCSRCPPLLSDCTSWQIDGSWRVAFGDGSEARYNFDAHGHCEVELPVSALPKKWRPYNDAYIPAGNDLPGTPQYLSLSDAEELCSQMPDCRGVTYNLHTGTKNGLYQMWLKSVAGISVSTGSQWRSIVNEQHPPLNGHASVAGPITLSSGTNQSVSNQGGLFRFDLHRAAPELFPEDSSELMGLVDGELRIWRRIRGIASLNGTGVQVRS